MASAHTAIDQTASGAKEPAADKDAPRLDVPAADAVSVRGADTSARKDAATLIQVRATRFIGNSDGANRLSVQKNYRGYRARRQLKGIGMDASTRWDEVCKSVREATGWRRSKVGTRP